MEEFKLIEYIKRSFNANLIGDDSAFLNSEQINLISKDILVEDVHFKINNNFFEIGVKSLIANVSDIIASGGIPLYFFLAIGIPAYLNESNLKEFLKGIKKVSKKYNVELAGGDISKSEKFFISVTITGKTILKYPITRSGAKVNDNIFVTGNLGDSEVGLRLILNKLSLHNEKLKNYFVKKHFFQKLYPEFVETLCKKCKINSMIDISDGFLQDLLHILKMSKKSAVIFGKSIPTSNYYKKLKKVLKTDFQRIPLISGEEYQLIFTSPENFETINSIARDFKIKITEVGKIKGNKKEQIKILDMFEKFDNLGYRHFL